MPKIIAESVRLHVIELLREGVSKQKIARDLNIARYTVNHIEQGKDVVAETKYKNDKPIGDPIKFTCPDGHGTFNCGFCPRCVATSRRDSNLKSQRFSVSR